MKRILLLGPPRRTAYCERTDADRGRAEPVSVPARTSQRASRARRRWLHVQRSAVANHERLVRVDSVDANGTITASTSGWVMGDVKGGGRCLALVVLDGMAEERLRSMLDRRISSAGFSRVPLSRLCSCPNCAGILAKTDRDSNTGSNPVGATTDDWPRQSLRPRGAEWRRRRRRQSSRKTATCTPHSAPSSTSRARARPSKRRPRT